jgi:23S rRNA (pseudouridine1915-N3)-methyltransferase
MYTSPELATYLEKNSARGEQIVFVIGGPLGLHESILQNASVQLSLSRLTFPHQMVRTILLEQIYRSVTIQMGKQYHY